MSTHRTYVSIATRRKRREERGLLYLVWSASAVLIGLYSFYIILQVVP